VDANTGLFGNTDDNIGISTGGSTRLLINNTNTTVTNNLVGTTAEFKVGSNQVAINKDVANGTTNGVVLNTDGNLEIIRSEGGAYLDLKNLATEDYDVRLQSVGTTGIFTLSNAGTETLRVTAAGFMGVGTNDPLSRLHVNGSIRVSGTGVNASVRLDNTSVGAGKDWRILQTNNGFFSINDNDTNTQRLIINTNSVVITGLITSTGTGLRAGIKLDNTTGGIDWRVLQKDGGYFAITDETVDQERLTIAGAGGIIRINAPSNLEVQSGGLTVNGFIRSNIGQITTGQINSPMTFNDSTAGLEVCNNGGTGDTNLAAMKFHAVGTYGVKMGLRSDGYFGIGGWSAQPWRWYVDTNTGNMTAVGNMIAAGNNISIGTGQAGERALAFVNNNREVYFYLAADGDAAGLWDATGGYNRFTTNADGNMYVRADVVAFASDARLKTNLRTVSDSPVADVCKLNGVRFDWNEHGPQPMRGTDVGLLAQDVQKVIPEAVAPAPFDNNYLTIRMNQQITALLVEAIKELNQRLKNLEG